MPTLMSRLDAVAISLYDTRAQQPADGYNHLLERMYAGPVGPDDFHELVPGFIEAVQRDIVRDAMQIRADIDAGRMPQILGYGGRLASIVAVPPDRIVPEFLVEHVHKYQQSLFPQPWEELTPAIYEGSWSWMCLYYLAIGTPTGDTLRAQLHGGEFSYLSASDEREGLDFERWFLEDADQIATAITATITDHAAGEEQPPRPAPDDIYSCIV